ncbi:M1 family metallopeptidase [Crassaminicella thermophila]|uniref:M1 family metallopeptidase n=1 Tax=Crassaminicella thermophila TaxID=2599308 RepID=A0A5C0SB76_CRATE|nr:M1 family metallopeptidase [Crassaminicella thermophila]QEK10946.1 M1 family metallopeptidase [Crassaminicella thermophila]
MRKILKKVGIILLTILLIMTGCKGKEIKDEKYKTLIVSDFNGVDPEKINQYDIDIVFSPKDATIKGIQRINYVNNEETPLSEVYFHLYPNSFRKKETAPFLMDDFDRAYPDGFKPGFIDVKKVCIGNKQVNYTLKGKGKTIMKIVLPHAIKPKDKILIEMEYTVKIPPARERFGYKEDTFNIGNWYPVVAVYDKTGWNLDPYYPLGDPFYSDVSNYKVCIETPKDYVVAASGNIIKDEIIDNNRLWHIEAKLMRDFAWVVSKDFEVIEKNVEGTKLKMYFMKDMYSNKEIINRAVNSAKNALKIFNHVYGKYPYGQYSVVQTNFPSGMEYPGIVFIDKNAYSDEWLDYLETVIVHETAHQWWYGIVGNDEIDEAWLDEALTAYSEVVYFKELHGDEWGENYHRYMNEQAYKNAVSSIENEVILKPLSKFEGWDDYGALVYNKGAMFVNAIYEKYGKKKFYEIMQKYYQNYRFKNATTKDFKKVCEEVTGEDLDVFFDEWLLAQ